MKNLLKITCLFGFVVLLSCSCPEPATRQVFPENVQIRQVTHGPKHHFASAYYHLRSWDASERHLLCLETDIENHNPEMDESATLGMIDLETGEFIALAETYAWNFQQGAMQQWLGSSPDSLVIYNDSRNGKFVSVILNVHTKKEVKVIDRPLSAVSHDGTKAVSFNFARLHVTRPGYGYPGPGDNPRMNENHPAGDGLYFVDLQTGQSRLIVSLEDVFQLNPPPAEKATQLIWMNHTLINTDGTRVFFLGRTPLIDRYGWLTAAYTVNLDGTELRCVLSYEWSGSHFDWLSPDRLMVTTYYRGARPWFHLLFTDTGSEDKDYRVLGEGVLVNDGHGMFSPDGRWMVTDLYPDGHHKRSLLLLNMDNDAVMPLGRFNDPPDNYTGPARCDLHARFNSLGNKLCFDSVDDGTRQIYIAELDFEK